MPLPLVHHVWPWIGTGHVVEHVGAAIGVFEAIFAADVGLLVSSSDRVPHEGLPGVLHVVQDRVRHRAPALGVVVDVCALPSDLRAEVLRSKDCIHHHLEIVAGGWVAMQIHRAIWCKHAMHLHEPVAHPFDVDLDSASPAVLEAPHLGFVAPNDLVLPVAEERWVKVDKVDAVGRHDGELLEVVFTVEDAGGELRLELQMLQALSDHSTGAARIAVHLFWGGGNTTLPDGAGGHHSLLGRSVKWKPKLAHLYCLFSFIKLPSRRRPSNDLEHLPAGEVAALDQRIRYSFDGRLG